MLRMLRKTINRYKDPDYWRRLRQNRVSERRLEERDPELMKLLRKLASATGVTGCRSMVYERIYDCLEKLRPECVLECGSGVSSALIASVLERNRRGHLYSVEEIPHWHDTIRREFPSTLAHRVTFVLSETAEEERGVWRGRYYHERPDYPYDFAFIDGPSLHSDATYIYDADLVQIVEKRQQPIVALIDGRSSTVSAWRALMELSDYADDTYSVLVKADRVASLQLSI